MTSLTETLSIEEDGLQSPPECGQGEVAVLTDEERLIGISTV